MGRLTARRPVVVFVHYADQRLYALEPRAATPRPAHPGAGPAPPGCGGPTRWRLPDGGEVWCVLRGVHRRRAHRRAPGRSRPCRWTAAPRRPRTPYATDRRPAPFVTGPRLSPGRARLAWIGWDHPRHAVGRHRAADRRRRQRRHARTAAHPSPVAPTSRWPRLLARRRRPCSIVSDPAGWWNLRRVGRRRRAGSTTVCPRQEEFGGPLWKTGPRWFAAAGRRPDRWPCTASGSRGRSRSSTPRPASSSTRRPLDRVGRRRSPRTDSRVVGVAGGPHRPYEVVELDTGDRRGTGVIGPRHGDRGDPADYPEPQRRTFTGAGRPRDPRHVYPPHNPDASVARRRPAAVRRVRARRPDQPRRTGPGPGDRLLHLRGHRRRRGQLRRLDRLRARVPRPAARAVGRRRRRGLRGGGARPGRRGHRRPGPARDPRRQRRRLDLRVRLAAGDVYACGTIHLPDPGPRPAGAPARPTTSSPSTSRAWSARWPRSQSRYHERSPVNHTDRITAPFLLLQGLDDVICPPVQSERLLARMAGRGIPHAYLAFEGEGHGFRRAETLIASWRPNCPCTARSSGSTRPASAPLELTT